MSTKEQRERIELLQGTLDLLILRTLLRGPVHGHAIAKAIEFNSDEVLQVEQESLYPALHRLIKRGWISVEEGTSENNRRAKFYRLTPKGRRQLVVETRKWDKLAGAVARVLRPEKQEGETGASASACSKSSTRTFATTSRRRHKTTSRAACRRRKRGTRPCASSAT